MTLNISRTSQRFMLLLITGAVCSCAAQSAPPSSTVEGFHPVAQAIEKLEAAYLLPITYEDVRHVHASETEIDEKARLVVKRETLSFSYELPASGATHEARRAQAINATAAVLRSYNAARGSEMFTLTEADGVLHVLPVQSLNTSGQMEKVRPLLDTPVSISPGQRTADQLVEEITSALSVATRRSIVAGNLPTPLFHRHATSITASNEPAGAILERLFQEIPVGYESKPNKYGGTHVVPGASLSWQVWCGPGTSPECTLNIHVVKPEGRAASGLEGAPEGSVRPEDQ